MEDDGQERGSNPCAPHYAEGAPQASLDFSNVAFNQLSYDHLLQTTPATTKTYSSKLLLIHTSHNQTIV